MALMVKQSVEFHAQLSKTVEVTTLNDRNAKGRSLSDAEY
jgi:hypothetical protein